MCDNIGEIMQIPSELSEKINSLYGEIKNDKIKDIQKNLTDKYKTKTGESKSLIDGKNDSILYAISRMPATYSVISTLLSDLINQEKLKDIKNIYDFGSGTGSGYFACKEIFENAKISLFERDKNMIETFSKLSSENVNKFDLLSSDFEKLKGERIDLIMSSYVLSELSENDRQNAFKKLLSLSSNYVLIIDTGTPKTYENMMKLKKVAVENGYTVSAPCKNENCPLQNDYCQFFARVERSALLRQAKDASLSYEDEKYFYLLFEKNDLVSENNQDKKDFSSKCRVIRRPKIKTNEIELVVCSEQGVENKKITKKDKELFKRAKKIKINQEF